MIQLAACLAAFVLLGLEFCIYGAAFGRLCRLKLRAYETVIFGFFVYFGLFQLAALPLILLQRPFHELAALWLIAVAAVDILAILTGRRELLLLFQNMFAGIRRSKGILLGAVFLLVVLCCWLQATQPYQAWWDTAYYVGTVDTTVYTDSMYRYNGNSGILEKTLDLRYALSAFYMHTAVLCKWTGTAGLLMQKYVMGTVAVFLHGCIIFSMGRRLFPQEEKKALFMTGLMFVLHLGFHSPGYFTASDFLLLRGYEAKGFCANVVIPAVMYAILCLWQDARRREHWFFAFAACCASVPVSMSSLLIVPAMMAVAALTECLVRKDWKILWRAFWCAAPNGFYLILYFLYTRGFQIMIRQ